MAVYFFDSSALVKRYAQETGSEWVIATTEPQAGHTLYIARITAVEVVSAITRRRRGGALSETDAATASFDFRYDLSHQYRVVEVTATVIAQAMELVVKQALCGYDAVHLGAALVVHNLRATLGLPAFVLVSADRELNVAATADGLTVDDPTIIRGQHNASTWAVSAVGKGKMFQICGCVILTEPSNSQRE